MRSCTNSCMTSCLGSCTVPNPNISGGSITICFPDKQIIPNGTCQTNPFYDTVNQRSYWSYTIETTAGIDKFEHWALQICGALAARKDKKDFSIDFSDNGGASFTAVNGFLVTPNDNLTGLTNCIRINESQAPTTCRIYRITILAPDFFNLAAEPGTVVARVESANLTFDPATSCSASPLLTPSINCTLIPVPPPPSKQTKQGGCEKILADKIVADQIFTCTNTKVLDLTGIPHDSNLDDISFTLQTVDCQPIIDTANDQVAIDMTFTLDADVLTSASGFDDIEFTISGIQVACSGTFCDISPDIFSDVDPAMVDCEFIRLIDITDSHDILTPTTLTTTITILSKFVLLLKEILVVAACPQKNAATTVISAFACTRSDDQIMEELREIIREEIKMNS
jgi:hypothetical protein